jgi:hypothetical protein
MARQPRRRRRSARIPPRETSNIVPTIPPSLPKLMEQLDPPPLLGVPVDSPPPAVVVLPLLDAVPLLDVAVPLLDVAAPLLDVAAPLLDVAPLLDALDVLLAWQRRHA